MRKKSFLLGVIFTILSFTMQAQIYEMFRQGFEVNETANYTVSSGTATPQTAFYYGGSRAIKMAHTTGSSTVILLDEIDMSNIATLNYFTLEFAHINNVNPSNCASAEQVAMIEAKLASSNTWTRLTSTYYDKTGTYSTFYDGCGYFSSEAYADWGASSGMDASWWRTERFNLDRIFTNVNAGNRKLNIRITLYPKTGNLGVADQGWYIDDIVVKASAQAIVKPVIKMIQYPDLLNHPSSRGAKIVAEVKAGNGSLTINPDSVYMLYKIGSSNTIHKQTLTPVTGVANRYSIRLPFEGYDTMMYFRIVAKDASLNENTATRPASEDAWYEYRCVRGQANSGYVSTTAGVPASPFTITQHPFPTEGLGKAEYVFDSALLHNAGFRAGSITGLSFLIKSGLQSATQTRQDVAIRMRNAYSTYTTSPILEFSNDYTQTVYRGNINFPITVNNNPYTMSLQDTFFYAGKDLIVQVLQNNSNDLTTAIGLGAINAQSSKNTLYNADATYMEYDPYSSQYDVAFMYDTKIPNLAFDVVSNPPLIHDCGVSAIVFPSASSAATANTNQQVQVTLKNFGVAALNGIRIAYKLDNNAPVYYNWTGTLAANQTQTVTLTSTQQFTPGYHTLTSWVEDTLTSGTNRYRDHEPYNDTSYCEFIACAGAMSGVRQIGGANADFSSMHEFLFSLSSCGISNGLTVKLAPGIYEPFEMPQFTGASATSYLTFEPLNSGAVIFESDSNNAVFVADFQNATYTKVKNITFRSTDVAPVANLVRLGSTSTGCWFEGCTFTDVNGATQDMINSGNCNNLTVKSCTFNGGVIGVDLSGMSINQRSSGNKVLRSRFNEQGSYGVYVYNQNNAEVDSNYFNNITSNAGYAVLLQNAYGTTKVTRNKIYTSHGAAAIGAATVAGTASSYAIIANNMIVSNDDGSAISIVSPLNIQSATYTKIVYNSVKFSADSRSDIAAASFGGVSIENCVFKNNIIATLDNYNYALCYTPGSNTTNQVGSNIYYARGTALNRYGSNTYNNINAWRTALPSDNLSEKVNPSYLNGELVDLRTFNQAVKNIAVPITEVTTDMFGTTRPTTPCVGAFEFEALFYDFEIVELVEPFDSYCGGANAIPLRLKLYNWGTTTFTPSASNPLKIVYQYGNILDSVSVSTAITTGDTTLVNTTATLNMPSNATSDRTYNLKLWVRCSSDPNNTNDTARYTVTSCYVSAAPTNVSITSPYQQQASINATAGISNWPLNVYTSGTSQPSTIYWYATPTSDSILYRGVPFVTDTLLRDTTFYFRQQRELPIIRISEVAFTNNYTAATANTVVGSTTPRPAWLSTTTKYAVELTNVGDYPADLYNDTVAMYSSNSSFNNKIFKIPSHVMIQPGASVVLQFISGITTTDSTVTIPATPSISNVPSTQPVAIVYRHNGAICDAVPIRVHQTIRGQDSIVDMTNTTQWNNLNVPSYIWAGQGLLVESANAGISRTGWPTNASSTPSNTAQYWRAATDQHPLTLGTTNEDLIMYRPNDCQGPRATATVTLTGVPNIDLAVVADPIDGGCGLGNETISCTLSNFGIQNCPVAYLCYSVNDTLIQRDTISNIASGASVHHVFSTTYNMHRSTDANFVVKTYVVRNTTELTTTIGNDTATISVQSLRTPDAPTATPGTTTYAQSATLSATSSTTSDGLVWYSRRGVALDTTSGTFVTPILYANDTFYVSSINVIGAEASYGTGTAQSAQSDKICPFAANNRHYKSQIIYTAAELLAAGVQPGYITSLAFEMTANNASAANTPTFSSYTISMGATTNELFTANNGWLTADNEVFTSSTVTFPNTALGWYTFDFQTPYLWDGTSNVVVQICRSMTSATSQTVKGRYTAKTNSCLGLTNDNAAVCASTGNGSRSANRPNVKIGYSVYGCDGDRTMVPVTVTGAPDNDAAIAWSDTTDYSNYSSCSNISLPIKVRNQGSANMTNFSVVMRVDGDSVATLQGTTTILAGDSAMLNLPAYAFTPGRHVVAANVVLSGDTITNNNQISRVVPIRFCGGTYNVGPGTSFVSIAAATDTLNVVGMNGSVIFDIASGTYTGQATFGSFTGADSSRTVTFQSQTGEAADVVLTANPTQDANYVLKIDGSQFLTLKNITIYGQHTTGSGNNIYASALQLANCSNVNIDSCVIRVKSTSSISNNAHGIIINDSVENVMITNSLIDSGYCGITTKATTADLSGNITISNNTIHGFFNRGINLRNLHDMTITENRIESATTAANRPLFGVYMAGHTGMLDLTKNQVYVADQYSGAKRGICLNNVVGTQSRRAKVYNNMVSSAGIGASGGTPAGLVVDSASSYINVYFNTFRVYAGVNAAASRAVSIGERTDNCTNINVRDNIMANFSQGYAYYVKSTAAIPSNGSNYNVYYTNASGNVPKFAFWGLEMASLADLQAANSQDDHSIVQQPYFVNDMSDLHVASGQFSDCAEYLAQVPQDIDGNTRPQIPNPTIGAHEYTRQQHDLSIIEVIEPVMPSTTKPHPTIEGKTMRVIVRIFNNGLNNESGATWSASLVGTANTTGTRTVPMLSPRQYWTDTAYIATQLGVVDTNYVHFVLDLASNVTDANPADNDTNVMIFLDPAYDLQVTSVTATGGCAPLNSNSTVTITIKNVGLDTIPVTMPLTFGYSAYTSYNANTGVNTRTISTFPQNVTETQYLTAFLPPQTSRPIILNTRANLYPTNKDTNMMAVKVRGWVHCQYDLYPTGNGHQDTALSGNINSYYTPQPPVGIDNHIPYATWDTVWASQRNSRPVEWYRDSTNLGSRFNNKTQYAASTHWDNGPQYFHDSTYYLRTTTEKGCSSSFSNVTVYVNPLVAKDAAVEQVLNPRPAGTVFAEDDTVKVRLINYGSQTISNIPVTYQLLNNAGTMVYQQVTETCTASIASGQTYDFNFDSLLQIPAPNTATSYKIRVWTDLPGEMVRLNDTIRHLYSTVYQGLNGSYGTMTVGTEGLDITRVSFNSLNNELFPLGYGYNNYGSYVAPEMPALHLTRGTQDTIIVACESNVDERSAGNGKIGVWIDYNRDGHFSEDETNEEWIYTGQISGSSPNNQVYIPITIPEDSWFGYMRMRIFVCGDDCTNIKPTGKVGTDGTVSNTITNGAVHDYMLYIDPVAPDYDVAITHLIGRYGRTSFFDTIRRFSATLDHRVEEGEYTIYFNLANKGANTLTNASINYSFNGPNDTTSGVIDWTGNLPCGRSTMVAVPAYSFDEGTTELLLRIDPLGDRDVSNNHLEFEFHRFHEIVLTYTDDFEGRDLWYAPKGYTDYTRNLWERGNPAKTTIVGTASGENAWCTDLTHTIVSGKRGNYSVLYSPIFNLSSIRSDTLTMYLNRAMPTGSQLTLQFYDFEHNWKDLFNLDTVTTWYNEDGYFSGSSNGRYEDKLLRLAIVSGDFPQDLQLRFIYRAAPGSSENTSYGDGCAIDDLHISRAQRSEDVGVVDIIEPVAPRYGETIYPKVVIKNYGYSTRNRVEVGYIPHGSNLSKTGVWTGELAPGDTVHYRFERGFVITADFPDTFAISAFTFLGTDIYYDNDSNTRTFILAPLSHDLNVQQIVSPTPRVVAGDSLDVTVRIRNFGTDPMDNISLTYVFNGANPVTEQVDFTQYVGPDGLPSMEYFNYTFRHRIRASLGYMTLQVYGHYDNDVYPYNDTVDKAIEGITSIKDIAATGIVIDSSAMDNSVRILLVIQNQGARSANDFEVGFYLDGDSSSIYRATYHTELPLASLAQTTFRFDSIIPRRNEPRNVACGFVHVPGDNNPSNDTTNSIVPATVDFKVHRVEIEENRTEYCRVRLLVENIGTATLPADKEVSLTGTINGVALKKTYVGRNFVPGNVFYLSYNDSVLKNASRDYQGFGQIYQAADQITTNNSTTIIQVLNYFENIVDADERDGIILHQNVPNPCDHLTSIDFEIPAPGDVTFYVVDLMGRMMYSETKPHNMGTNTIRYNATELSSGTYFYGIIYDGKRVMRKMVVK